MNKTIYYIWLLLSITLFVLRAFGIVHYSWWIATIGLWLMPLTVFTVAFIVASFIFLFLVISVLGGKVPSLTYMEDLERMINNKQNGQPDAQETKS